MNICVISTFLAIINNATMNIYKYFLILTYIFMSLGKKFLGEELLGPMVILCLIFCETAELFSKVLYHFTFSPAMCEGTNFSITSPTLAFTVCLFFSFIY